MGAKPESMLLKAVEPPPIMLLALNSRVQLEIKKCFEWGQVGHLIKNCKNRSRIRKQTEFKLKPRYRLSSRSFRLPHQVSSTSVLLTDGYDLEFILDSATTDHFSFDTHFHNFNELRSQAVIAKRTTDICETGGH